MKLIIIEGTDRTGKDTLVNRLIQDHRNVIKRHWSFPQGQTNEAKTKYQKNSFLQEFSLYKRMSDELKDGIMIWNRAHLGEFVYGTIYRDSQPETWVWDLEESNGFPENPDVYLILLHADPEFVVSQEDGNSYSAKLEDKTKEIHAFLLAFIESGIKKKLMVRVNNKNEYVDKEDIYQRVKQFINDEQP